MTVQAKLFFFEEDTDDSSFPEKDLITNDHKAQYDIGGKL